MDAKLEQKFCPFNFILNIFDHPLILLTLTLVSSSDPQHTNTTKHDGRWCILQQ